MGVDIFYEVEQHQRSLRKRLHLAQACSSCGGKIAVLVVDHDFVDRKTTSPRQQRFHGRVVDVVGCREAAGVSLDIEIGKVFEFTLEEEI